MCNYDCDIRIIMAAWDLCVILPVWDTLQMKGKHVLNSGKMWYIPMKLKQFKILIRFFFVYPSTFIYFFLALQVT